MTEPTHKRKTTRSYIEYDFELAEIIGTSATLVLGALINHYTFFKNNNQLKDGKFFNTKEDIGIKTNLKPSAVRKAELLLQKIGYISLSPRQGNAGRLNDYTIHFDRINQSLETIKPFLKNDSIGPKERLNQSLGQGNQHKQSTHNNKMEEEAGIININNQHIESYDNHYTLEHFDSLFNDKEIFNK